MLKIRVYCPYCSKKLSTKHEGENVRDYCGDCKTFFYDNPLPVASAIVVKERSVLLVRRKNEPQKGEWCLPMGFAETGESIQAAALRELKEEAGIDGKIIDFVCVDSGYSKMYGDLIFVTFEAEWIGGVPVAGDDAEAVQFFPVDQIPPLAFDSNIKAFQRYLLGKQEFWAIVDSFNLSVAGQKKLFSRGSFLSDKLVGLIESNAEVISNRWLNDVKANPSTPTYARIDSEASLKRNLIILKQFGKWLDGIYDDREIRKFYRKLGRDRRTEGFEMSEILSAISLTRKYIWEFALSQRMWTSAIDIYSTLELERRMMLFFDRASYYAARGFEDTNVSENKS